jgi:hypothetical protein
MILIPSKTPIKILFCPLESIVRFDRIRDGDLCDYWFNTGSHLQGALCRHRPVAGIERFRFEVGAVRQGAGDPAFEFARAVGISLGCEGASLFMPPVNAKHGANQVRKRYVMSLFLLSY